MTSFSLEFWTFRENSRDKQGKNPVLYYNKNLKYNLEYNSHSAYHENDLKEILDMHLDELEYFSNNFKN